ncbi:TMM81 protein, partial [Menura novaehollandiae]|nr:TMM81 protein [Menura novaehollandiae]
QPVMKNSPILGILLCALCVPAGTGTIPAGAGAIPAELRAAVARIAVNSTPCSVTCGPGVKVERLCEITPAGERRNCSLVRSRCLSDWICGLRHFTIPEGKPFQLSCLVPSPASDGRQTYGYTWRFARGLITTSDILFQPLRHPSASLGFSPARESHSGTYRCDVQELSSFKLLQRIYFGLRVIPRDLVELNFQESLTWEQKLAADGKGGGAGNGTGQGAREQQENFREKGWIYEAVLGIGSGVIVGILLSLGLCCLGRVWKR